MIKTKLALAAAIVLGSAVGTAQAQYYDYSGGPGSLRSLGAPPPFSEFPAATGGGSIGYNDNIRKDAW